MQVTRISMLTGQAHTLDIPVTREQLIEWERGALIQDAMPNLTPSQREFIKSGITDEEWSILNEDNDSI